MICLKRPPDFDSATDLPHCAGSCRLELAAAVSQLGVLGRVVAASRVALVVAPREAAGIEYGCIPRRSPRGVVPVVVRAAAAGAAVDRAGARVTVGRLECRCARGLAGRVEGGLLGARRARLDSARPRAAVALVHARVLGHVGDGAARHAVAGRAPDCAPISVTKCRARGTLSGGVATAGQHAGRRGWLLAREPEACLSICVWATAGTRTHVRQRSRR